jgi:Tfp pilus assembly protein PilF
MKWAFAPASSPHGRIFSLTVLTVCVVSTVSCTHQMQTASMPAPVPAVHAVMVRQARNAADAGDGDLELRRLRQFLAANPSNPDARILMARYYDSHGLPDLALEHYRLAAAQFPESPAIAIALAKTLRSMGEPTESVRTLREYAARQSHANWEVLSLEGILEDEQTHYAAAESAHRAAVAAAPERSDLHNNLGYNLLTQKRTDAAIEEFRRAIELDGKSEIAHNNLGAALASLSTATNDTAREAVAEWSRSTGQAEAHNNMAAVLIDQGRYDEARAELSSALSLDPSLGAAMANLRLLAERDGRPAALPVRAAKGGKRHVSLWAKIFRRGGESKPAAAGLDTDVPTSGAQGNSASVDTQIKK